MDGPRPGDPADTVFAYGAPMKPYTGNLLSPLAPIPSSTVSSVPVNQHYPGFPAPPRSPAYRPPWCCCGASAPSPSSPLPLPPLPLPPPLPLLPFPLLPQGEPSTGAPPQV